MNPQAPERAELRERLVAHWVSKGEAAITGNKYADVVATVAQIGVLYSPEEWASGAIPGGLEHMAKYLVAKGEPRGDEARVLSGLLIQKLLHPDDPKIAEYYERLVSWGFDARVIVLLGTVQCWP